MNDNLQTTNKTITITPSARKSIHSDCAICLLKGVGGMGKYGLGNKCTNNISDLSRHGNASHDDGVDEVDNMKRSNANHLSPKAYIRKVRKNSVDSRDQIYSDESNDEDTSEEFNSLDTADTCTPEKTRKNKSNVSNSNKLSPRNLQINNSKISKNEYLASNNGVNWKHYFIVSIIILIIALSFHFYNDIFTLLNHKNNIMIYDETKFHNDVTYLGEKYKVTDDSILQIQTGISTIFHRQDAGSFVFTYNSKNSNYNPALFNNFMNDVATAAAKYLRNDSNVHDHVIVDSGKLDMRVHGELIERYREDVAKTGVMLVRDIDEVPAPLAMAFHYYCDEFNPLIKRSAIFFTLNMARCSDQKTSHANIEKCLANKWTAIPKVNIVPLLARVVSILVDVTNVF